MLHFIDLFAQPPIQPTTINLLYRVEKEMPRRLVEIPKKAAMLPCLNSGSYSQRSSLLFAGEDCKVAAAVDGAEGARSFSISSSAAAGAALAGTGAGVVVTALHTEWLANSVRMSFRRRRLR